jgi:hypothetical protein
MLCHTATGAPHAKAYTPMLRFLRLLPRMYEHHCVEERGENIAVVTRHTDFDATIIGKKIQVQVIVKCEVALALKNMNNTIILIR